MALYNKDAVFEDVEAVKKHITPFREKCKIVVTTNGCFDILHVGHVQYLSEAASKGDILIVGVNSDEVVKKLKGSNRPIQSEKDRVALIGALKMVDCAFIFREDDPRPFLEILRPDFHVKGGDYTQEIIEKPVVEAYGGKISIVSFKWGCSTTDIINKLSS